MFEPMDGAEIAVESYISLLTADSPMKELPALCEQAGDETEREVLEVLRSNQIMRFGIGLICCVRR